MPRDSAEAPPRTQLLAGGGSVRRIYCSPLFRFAFSGVLATGIHYAVAMWYLTFVHDSPALANGLAFIIATLFSCVMNTLWSFSRILSVTVVRRFGVVACLGCLLSVCVAGTAAWLGIPNQVGIFCTVLFVTPVTFLLHRHWTYRLSGT